MKHTITVLVENNAGVLARISGLFARRGFNIDSLAVGVTDNPDTSRMTIIVNGDDYTVEQVEKQLNKLIDVIKVKTLRNEELLSRELMLIKIDAPPQKRSEILDIIALMGGKVSDVTRSTITVEISDTPERLNTFEELLRPYKIKETARTGVIAMQK